MSRLERYPLKAYGVWAGNPKGTPYDEERCAYAVVKPRGIAHQCSRRATTGMWCLQHHPDSIQQRRRDTEKKYDEQMAAVMAPFETLKAYRRILRKIAKGKSKNPMLLAKHILKKWDDE